MILGAVNFSKQAKQSKVAVSSGEEGAQNVGSQETASATAPDVILTDLSATGTYESFKNLLTGLEQNLRLADVQSISFAGKGESANLFEFKVAAKIYYKGL